MRWVQLTDDEVRAELVSYRHDNLLERVNVICVAHTRARPGYVDAPETKHQPSSLGIIAGWYSHALTFALSDHIDSSKVACRVEMTAVVSVDGHV